MLVTLLLPLLVLVQAAVFLAPGFFVSLWLIKNKGLKTLYALPVAALAGCLIGYLAFWLYFALPVAGRWFSLLLMLASWAATIVLFANKQARSLLKQADVWIPLALLLSVVVFYNALFVSCEPVASPSSCYTEGLPMDNVLQQIFANNVANGQAKDLIGDWHGSDRPPLQSGVVLGESPLTTIPYVGYNGYQLLSSLLQCLWVSALWVFGRCLKLKASQLALLIGLCAATGFFFLNSVFVWPKLLAAALGLFAFCLLFFEKSNRLNWALAGLFLGTSFLSHSGVIFTFIPMVIALCLPRFWQGWRLSLMVVGTAALLIVPWLAYQHFYDPPGDRLVKWHLAGDTQPDNNSFLHDFVYSYTHTPVQTLAHNKLSNAHELIGYIPSESALYGGGFLAKLRDMDFRYLLVGLTIFNIGWIALAIPRARKAIAHSFDLERLKLPLIIAAASIVIWTIAMFGPKATPIHQGSYLTMLLLFGGLGALILQMPKWLRVVAITAQIAYFAVVWVLSVVTTHSPSTAGLTVALVGLGAFVWCIYKTCNTPISTWKK